MLNSSRQKQTPVRTTVLVHLYLLHCIIYTKSLFRREEITEIDEFDEFILNQIRQFSIRAEHVAKETRKDSHLGKIMQLLEAGQNLTRYGFKSPECNHSLLSNCLIFEHRVGVPLTLRQPILNDVHEAHIRVVKIKGIARSFVYWPCIDADIERNTKSCTE